ncbi:MAG: tetratricopeptide repeat protein [Planctomycetota bacterium]
MQRLLLTATLTGLAMAGGCASDYPVERVERPVNVTHEVAFGDYRRVFNTTYHILNRYGVVQTSSYRYGEIRALVGEDTSLFQKTRREIEARIVDTGDYWDVQCRVLIKVEDSEPATFQDKFNPLYEWRTVASDPRLEVRLNNEIRAALSGGAWQAKEPLRPEPRAPHVPAKKAKDAKQPAQQDGEQPKKKAAPKGSSSADTDEVSDEGEPVTSDAATGSAFERLGILRLRRGAWDDAAQAFRAAASSPEARKRSHFLLAQAELGLGRSAEALAEVRSGLRENPAWVGSDIDLRDLCGNAATFDRQVEAVAKAAGSAPELSFLLGYLRFHSGDAAGALVAFDSYLAANPEDAVAKTYRGHARQRVDAAHGLENF